MCLKLIALHDQRELQRVRPGQSHKVTAAQFYSSVAARTGCANRDALVATLSGKPRAPRIREPQLHRAQPRLVQALAVATDAGGEPALFALVPDFHPLHVTPDTKI